MTEGEGRGGREGEDAVEEVEEEEMELVFEKMRGVVQWKGRDGRSKVRKRSSVGSEQDDFLQKYGGGEAKSKVIFEGRKHKMR